KARLADLGGTALAGSPADFGKLIADETEKWGNVIRPSTSRRNETSRHETSPSKFSTSGSWRCRGVDHFAYCLGADLSDKAGDANSSIFCWRFTRCRGPNSIAALIGITGAAGHCRKRRWCRRHERRIACRQGSTGRLSARSRQFGYNRHKSDPIQEPAVQFSD